MSKDVIVVLFSGRPGNPCRELVLVRTKRGLPVFTLPTGNAEDEESLGQAASHIAYDLGCVVPPSAWRFAGDARSDTATVVTASISSDAFAQLQANPKLYVSSSELTMCDAWVNPQTYERDFLYLLVLARAAY